MTVQEFRTAAGSAAAPARRHVLRLLLGHRTGLVGGILLVLVLLGALAALFSLTPYDPITQTPSVRLRGPSRAHPLGTDQFGRDVFSRCLAGTSASLRVALVAVGLAAVIGTVLGVLAGYLGGVVDAVVSGVTNVLFAFPAILLAMVLLSALGRGWLNIAVAIAVVYTPIFVRVTRGPVLALRNVEFVQAGRVLGYSTPRLLARHILPNIAAVIIVQVTMAVSWAFLTEAGLSFLGLGPPPPTASLGLMVSESRNLAATAWWTLTGPAVFIAVAVLALNLLGDGLRDILDPRRT